VCHRGRNAPCACCGTCVQGELVQYVTLVIFYKLEKLPEVFCTKLCCSLRMATIMLRRPWPMIVSRADTALLVQSTSRRREHTRGLMHVLRPGSEEPLLEIGDRSLDSGIHRHRETSSSLSTRVQTSLLAGEIFSFHSPQRSHVLLPLVSHHRSSEKPCRRYRAAPGTCFA